MRALKLIALLVATAAVACAPAQTSQESPELAAKAELDLETLASIPASGFPSTCGVPLPAGRVKTGDEVTLRDGSGRIVPVQTSVLNRWPDGSVRWLLVNNCR